MSASKDKERGTWKIYLRYVDWQGVKQIHTKRGFTTKREALEYEREFLASKSRDLNMLFESFVEIYLSDLKPRIKYNTYLTKVHIIESKLERRTDEFKDAVESCSGIENLDPRFFKQPSLLGGGKCGGCPILSYFSRLVLEGKTSIDGYYFWDLAELLEATKIEPFFLELCKVGDCYKTYQSIVEDGYDAHLETCDQIKVEVKGGIYEVGEGKHRVCAMKRFGYDHKVPMRVTRSAVTAKYGNVTESHDMERVLKDCYDRYRVLGIPDEVVRRCLRDPSATVMDYLNASCYSYEEMYERCKPTIG